MSWVAWGGGPGTPRTPFGYGPVKENYNAVYNTVVTIAYYFQKYKTRNVNAQMKRKQILAASFIAKEC